MTALWLEPDHRTAGPIAPVRAPGLRLVGTVPAPLGDPLVGEGTRRPHLAPVPDGAGHRPGRPRASVAVRRRRTLLATTALLAVLLALPLSGTGGHSHPTGSAPAETQGATYTVQPGDTLWTIAERLEPTADPRPLVARLAAQTGSDTVVPGERIVLP